MRASSTPGRSVRFTGKSGSGPSTEPEPFANRAALVGPGIARLQGPRQARNHSRAARDAHLSVSVTNFFSFDILTVPVDSCDNPPP
jgi:hypothetical protein